MKKFLLFFFVIFSISFSELKDGLNLFSEEDKKILTEVIEELEEKNELKIYVITSEYGEGYVVENPERTIIINVQKIDKKKIKIEESFTNDLNMQEKEKEINLLLDNLEVLVTKEEYVKYIEEVLRNSIEIYRTIDNEELDSETFFHRYKWEIIKWIVIILTLVNIVVRIRIVSGKKKLKAKQKSEEILKNSK